MAIINLDFRSRGANVPLSDLQKIQNRLRSTQEGTSNLAKSLNTGYESAKKFAISIGLTSDKAASAVEMIQRLSSVNANNAVKYQALNRELGITRQQFLQLNSAIASQSANLGNSRQKIAELAQSLKLTHAEARSFAKDIGLTATKAKDAVNQIRELDRVNTSVAAKYRSLRQEMNLTRKQFEEINSLVSKQSNQLNTVQLGAIAFGAQQATSMASGVGKESLQVFVTLQDTINQFAAMSGESEEQVEKVRAKVEELGATTAKTATEVGQSSISLARMGFNGEEIVNLLPAVTQGAIATSESMELLGTVLGNAAVQFNEMNASEARFSQINDAIVNTANSSATDVSDLGEALSYVGSTAKNANQDVETTLAILGLFANAGIRGSRAGTALGNVITRLRNAAAEAEDPTNKAAKALKELGVDITDGQGQLKDLSVVLPQVINGLRGIENVGQRGILLQDIFDLRQARDFSTLLNLSNQQIDDFIGKIKNSSGASQKASDRVLQELSGSIKLFESAMEGAQIEVGEELGKTLEPVVKTATDLLTAFVALPAPIKSSLINIAAFATAITAAVAVVASLKVANELLGISQMAVSIATGSTAAIQKTATIGTVTYDLATKRLTVSSLAQALASQAVAVAETARAIATGKANAATTAGLVKLGVVAGLFAGAGAAIYSVIETYNDLNRASNATGEGTKKLRDELTKLDESLLKNATTSEETKKAISSIAEQNFEQLKKDLGGVQNAVDTFRKAIGSKTVAEAAANRQTVAFSEQIDVVDVLLGRYGDLRSEIDKTGSVDAGKVESQLEALNTAKEQLQQEKPVTEQAVQAKENYIKLLDKAIASLSKYSAKTESATNLQDENTESLNEQSTAMQKRNEALAKASDKEAFLLNEIDRQLIAGKSLYKDTEEEKIKITKNRIEAQLEIEKKALADLDALRSENGDDPETGLPKGLDPQKIQEYVEIRDSIFNLEKELVSSLQQEHQTKLDKYDRFLEEVETRRQKAEDRASVSEKERSIELQRLINSGVLTTEKAEELKSEATRDRITKDLAAEKRKLNEISFIIQTDKDLREKQDTAIKESKSKALDLTLELLEQEQQAEERTIEALSTARDNYYSALEQRLTSLSELRQQYSELDSDRAKSAEKLADLELTTLNRALEIRRQLSKDDLNPTERQDLIRELNSLGIKGKTSELALLQKIEDRERALAKLKLDNLKKQQEQERILLDIENDKLELSTIKAYQEAQKAVNDAEKEVASTESAIAEADTPEELAKATELNQLAQRSLKLAESQVDTTKQQLDDLDNIIERKKENLKLSQQIAIAEMEATNNTEAYSRRRDRTEARSGEDLSTEERVNKRVEQAKQDGKEITAEEEEKLRDRFLSQERNRDNYSDAQVPRRRSRGYSISAPPEILNAINSGKPFVVPSITNKITPLKTQNFPAPQGNLILDQLRKIETKLKTPTVINQENNFTNSYERLDSDRLLRQARSEAYEGVIEAMRGVNL